MKVTVSRVGESVLVEWTDNGDDRELTALLEPDVADLIGRALVAAAATDDDTLDDLLAKLAP